MAKSFLTRDKKRLIILPALAVLFVVCLVLGIVFAAKSCTGIDGLLSRDAVSVGAANTTQVGAYYVETGTVKRNKPVSEARDGGLASGYPEYGKTLNLTTEQKNAIIEENNSLVAGTSYDKMDQNGYLYLKGEPVKDASGEHRQLYRHTASVGLYYGDVSDSEPGVVKQMSFRHRTYNSYYEVTGLYAPAGEVIKVQMSEEDMEKTDGISIHIGQALYNGQANNIWAAREFNRMPVILNTMNMTKDTSELEGGVYTCYVGSYFGGPIYIRDETESYTVTISGGVNYAHYILGVTTEDEFEKLSKSTAPYFDLEVWESGVLHSGPKTGAPFNYEQLTKAAILWEKISIVSTKVTNQGIVFIYDPFVAAGAAVAFPGRRSVNCPAGWMANSLNYEAFVSSGSWGNMHEYHHNFQGGWGFGYTGEVTNNALNLVSYSLFTKISATRSIGSYGAAGLSGWNMYTSAPWALNRVNTNQIGDTNGLAVYATLLHNFGQDAFVSAKASGAEYLNKWAEVTHQDFGYYASLVESYSGVAPSALKPTEYSAFVPVSCVYQTGRSYVLDGEKKYIQTMQPFVVGTDEPTTIDLRPYTVDSAGQYEKGSIVIGKGLSYKVKSVNSDGINGKLKNEGDDVYTYTPSKGDTSGKIYVTLEIVDENGVLGGKKADDVELVIEFTHSQEAVRFKLNRTVYTYKEGAVPTSAEEAFNNKYAGNIGKVESDNVNATQNSNTDVWLYEEGSKPNNAPDTVVRTPNSVVEVSGKLYFETAGKYRIVLRGRWNAALFVSLDGGKNYKLAAKLDKADIDKAATFSLAREDYYFDFETSDITGDEEGYVYFKSVLVTKENSFMGLGFAQWTVPQYTTKDDYDERGNIIKTHYYDGNGNEVSAAEAQNAQPIEPTDANKISYATAYRASYTPAKAFESEYFYKKEYNYTYHDDDAVVCGENSTLVGTNNMNTKGWGGMAQYDINKMFDGNPATSFVSQYHDISDDAPYYIYGDVGETVSANYLNIIGSATSAINYQSIGYGMPLKFSFFVADGADKIDLSSPLIEVDEEEFSGLDKNYPFGGKKSFRYWCLVIQKTPNNRVGINRLQFKNMSFDLTIEGGNDNQKSPDDSLFTYRGNWQAKAANSKFGHVNVGGKNATVDFKFEGTRLIITSSKSFGSDYKVVIDGQYVNSEPLKADDGESTVTYLSPELGDGVHSAVIVCKGEANIESIVFSSDYVAHYDTVVKRAPITVAWKVLLWLALAFAVALGVAVLVFILIDRKKSPVPATGKKKTDKKKNKTSASAAKADKKAAKPAPAQPTKTAKTTSEATKTAPAPASTRNVAPGVPTVKIPTRAASTIQSKPATPVASATKPPATSATAQTAKKPVQTSTARTTPAQTAKPAPTTARTAPAPTSTTRTTPAQTARPAPTATARTTPAARPAASPARPTTNHPASTARTTPQSPARTTPTSTARTTPPSTAPRTTPTRTTPVQTPSRSAPATRNTPTNQSGRTDKK